MSANTVRVGLLLCDHLDDEVQVKHGDYTQLFPEAFGHTAIQFHIYDAINGDLPLSGAEQDAWMVSGSRHSAYDNLEWISQLSDFLSMVIAAGEPLVGICFGHQLIAKILGGHVAKAEVGWGIGRKSFDIVNRPEWFPPFQGESLTMYMSHQDQVLTLPEQATRIATSEYCPNAAYSVGLNIFCVQGHPEFTPAVLATLLERRRELLGQAETDTALDSLKAPMDKEAVPRLIEWFFQQHVGATT